MQKFFTKYKDLCLAILLCILVVMAVYYNAKPVIYMGYIIALALVFFIGSFAGSINGAIMAVVGVGLGLGLRHFFPIIEKLKEKQLEAFLEAHAAYTNFIAHNFVWMLLLAGLLAYLGGLSKRKLLAENSKRISTNRLTYMAFFVALSVAINSLRVGSVSFGGFPIILSGYMMGPVAGFIVGAVADVVGFIIRPSASAFNPLFVLTSALTGYLPVLVTNLLGGNKGKYAFIKVLTGIAIGQFTTSVVMVPLFRSFLQGNTFWYYFIRALPKQVFSVPLYAFLSITLSDRIGKAIHIR